MYPTERQVSEIYAYAEDGCVSRSDEAVWVSIDPLTDTSSMDTALLTVGLTFDPSFTPPS